MKDKLLKISGEFQTESGGRWIEPSVDGYVNDTFIVGINNSNTKYILQKKNRNVFCDIPGMMDNIEKISQHLKNKIISAGGDPSRQALTIIRSKDEKLYFRDGNGDFWTMYLYINDHMVYDKAETPALAFAGGKGIGMFQSMLADFDAHLVNTLPGFHDMHKRFEQWDLALCNDSAGRKKELVEEIDWIGSRRDEMLAFWSSIQNGTLPKRITHNDAKINNILFDRDHEVLCMIDLDTVLMSPVLNDFGDAIRSYTNTGKEDERDPDRIKMDLRLFEAFTEGYFSEAGSFLRPIEVDHLAFSASYITFEQVLRFLMDYINGDSYYKTAYPDHNLVRTHAQYALLKSIEQNMDQMNQIVHRIADRSLNSKNDD